MRTTVTLDDESRLLLERLMGERGLGFKEAVNEAIHRGLAPATGTYSATKARSLGAPLVDFTKALALAADLEDEALAARLADGR